MTTDVKVVAGATAAIVASGFTFKGIRNRLFKKNQKKIEKLLVKPSTKGQDYVPIIKDLFPWLDKHSTKVDMGGATYTHYNVPCTVMTIFNNALNGVCVTRFYHGGDNIFSMMQSNTLNGLEITYVDGKWLMYHNKRQVGDSEALLVYTEILNSVEME